MTSKEALEKIKLFVSYNHPQEALYLCETEEYKTIKKDLKALEIINDKNVNVAFLKALINKNFSVVEYNISSNTGLFLTSDEFNFLKEVLCKD